ncbi:MAG: hypothetical protein M1383_03740 [Patescibacteria group bacterium]|nr:hypothetical protein [Patescibacteria group bacterium]
MAITGHEKRSTLLAYAGIIPAVPCQAQICTTITCARRIAKALLWYPLMHYPRGYSLLLDTRKVPCLGLQRDGVTVVFTGWGNVKYWQAQFLQDDIVTGFLQELVEMFEMECAASQKDLHDHEQRFRRSSYYSNLQSQELRTRVNAANKAIKELKKEFGLLL